MMKPLSDDQFWAEAHGEISGVGSIDKKIDAIEREMGLHQAVLGVYATSEWGLLRAKLVSEFQSLLKMIASGVKIPIDEIRFLQGKASAIEGIIIGEKDLRKASEDARERLDALRKQRQNLTSKTQVPETGGNES